MPDIREPASPLSGIRRLIGEYPKLALPTGVFVALLGLATVLKTLIDGFTWAHTHWGYPGVAYVLGAAIALLLITIPLMNFLISPRPEIQYFPKPYLSRSPTIKWDYEEPADKRVSYRVVVKNLDSGRVDILKTPYRMRHASLRGLCGNLSITVCAVADGKVIRRSRQKQVEVYSDALHRIQLTGRLSVAVHADPGEEVSCYYRDDDWQGFDIDFVRLIAADLQEELALDKPVEVDFLFYPWPAVIASPNDYEVDLAIASIGITDDRIKQYKIMFSEYYTKSKVGLVGRDRSFDGDTDTPVDLDRLKGKTVAVHNATTAEKFVEKVKQDDRYRDAIEFRVAYDNDELRELLKNGTVDAAIYDWERAFSLLDYGMFVQQLSYDIPHEEDRYGIAFAKISTRLLEKVNAIIERRRDQLEGMLAGRVAAQYRKIAHEKQVG